MGSRLRRVAEGSIFWALLTGLTAFCLLPFLWQLVTSLKPASDLGSLPPLFPTRPVLDHYVAIFQGRPFGRFILNSVIVASLTTVSCLSVGSLAAFAVAKLQFRGRNLLLFLALSISMFPPIATVSPLYLLIRTFGWRDSYIGLVVPYTTFALPLAIWILWSVFREIPDELYLAALVDGCTPLQVFVRIFLPLAAPGIGTAAILVFIFAWNEFLYALTFTSQETMRTIPVAIALFPGLHEVPWGEIAAATIVVTAPLILLVLLFQRHIVSGLTAGSVKG
ncbi:sugar ABC transporter permease [Candidatus Methylomirabilis lanthanidiphila]|uniref:Sugar ABC transporter permease n=1 Tax=Candidatus Methylomirabilis lanthanidiphila TaxID=2211376 RepID=A0A564ZK18_9BACT|nr:sugar ABC transporter permease [Candidatus Methylomirabilis lanthanidiphila]